MPDPKTALQSKCPFCGSVNIVINAKNASPSSYLRCGDCGEVWHPDRLHRLDVLRGVGR